MSLSLDFPYNFLVFYPISVIPSAYQRACKALYVKWKIVWKNKKGKEEKEDEDFQLLHYLCYIAICGIDGFLNHCALQICKRFRNKLLSFEERWSFLHLVDLKHRLETRFSCQSGAEMLLVIQTYLSWWGISCKFVMRNDWGIHRYHT